MTSPQHSLDSKVVLITGGAKRIGAAIATTLHATGMNLVIHFRHSGAEAQSLADALNETRPDSVVLVEGDLEKPEDCTVLAQQAMNAFGRMDALINNASAFFPTPMGEVTNDHWEALMGVNLKAPFFLSQACAKALTFTQGAIINLTDIYADRPLPRHPVYSASKAGLVALTRSLAQELGPDVRGTRWHRERSSGLSPAIPKKIRMKSSAVHRWAGWVTRRTLPIQLNSCCATPHLLRDRS